MAQKSLREFLVLAVSTSGTRTLNYEPGLSQWCRRVHSVDCQVRTPMLIYNSSLNCATPSLSMKPGRHSTKGYAQGSDLSVDRCASYELDGDARHKVLSRFGRREGVIPTSYI
jgi:hypothetical protein